MHKVVKYQLEYDTGPPPLQPAYTSSVITYFIPAKTNVWFRSAVRATRPVHLHFFHLSEFGSHFSEFLYKFINCFLRTRVRRNTRRREIWYVSQPDVVKTKKFQFSVFNYVALHEYIWESGETALRVDNIVLLGFRVAQTRSMPTFRRNIHSTFRLKMLKLGNGRFYKEVEKGRASLPTRCQNPEQHQHPHSENLKAQDNSNFCTAGSKLNSLIPPYRRGNTTHPLPI